MKVRIYLEDAINVIEHKLEEPAYQHTGEDWYVGMNSAITELYNLSSAESEQSTTIDNALELLDGIYSSGRMEYYSDYIALHDAISLMNVEPERKPGKWIHKKNVYGVVYCSECDYELCTNDTNYCPNCGAKMEVKK